MLLQPSALPAFLTTNTFVPLLTYKQCAVCNSVFAHTEFPLPVDSSTLYACSHYCKLVYEEMRLDRAGQTPQIVAKKRNIAEITENKNINDTQNNKKQNIETIKINLEYSALILDTNIWISQLPFVQSLKMIQGLKVIVPSIGKLRAVHYAL